MSEWQAATNESKDTRYSESSLNIVPNVSNLSSSVPADYGTAKKEQIRS